MSRTSSSLIYPSESLLLQDLAELQAIASEQGLDLDVVEEIAAFVGDAPHDISARLFDFAKTRHPDQEFEFVYYSETPTEANYQGQIRGGSFVEDLDQNHVAFLYWDFLSACEGLCVLDGLLQKCSAAMRAELEQYHQRVLAQTDLLKQVDGGFEIDEDRLQAQFESLRDELQEELRADIDALLRQDDEARELWAEFVAKLPQVLSALSADMQDRDPQFEQRLEQSRATQIFGLSDQDLAQGKFLGLKANQRLACLLLAAEDELGEGDLEFYKTIIKSNSYNDFSASRAPYDELRAQLLKAETALQNKIVDLATQKSSEILAYVLADQLVQDLTPATLDNEEMAIEPS